jgi:hypothetical protein
MLFFFLGDHSLLLTQFFESLVRLIERMSVRATFNQARCPFR